MSLAFAKKFGASGSHEDAREFTRKAGCELDSQGRPIYVTEQSHKMRCDLNMIIRRAQEGGGFEHVNLHEPVYADCTGADFRTSLEKIRSAEEKFMQFSPVVRARFGNDPAQFYEFYENPSNVEVALAENLPLRSDWKIPEESSAS